MIGFDDEIDRRYLLIETGVQSLLARQTPVAIDLRLVLAVLRVNLHLERMADYCVTVAKLTKLMGGLDVSDDGILSSLEDMGQRAEQMIRVALDAFADRDLEKAESLNELDELIDRANRRAVEDVLSLGDSAEEREYGLRMLVISRCVERIGDHAVDIGEQIAYLVTGDFRELTDASHPVSGILSDSRDAGRDPPDAARERAHLPGLVAHRAHRARRLHRARADRARASPTSPSWPYEVVGAGYGLLGIAFIVIGQLRVRSVERAVDSRRLLPPRRAARARPRRGRRRARRGDDPARRPQPLSRRTAPQASVPRNSSISSAGNVSIRVEPRDPSATETLAMVATSGASTMLTKSNSPSVAHWWSTRAPSSSMSLLTCSRRSGFDLSVWTPC